MKKKYFPIFVDIASKPVLVIGAGEIAYRKIMNLLDFEADVVCIAPMCIPEINRLAEKSIIKYTSREYQSGDTADFDFVFAATNNPDVDRKIQEDCKNTGANLNVADVPDLCSFIMPAYLKRGQITFAISTGGTAPFFAKYLKDRLNDVFPETTADMAKLASYFRRMMVADLNYNNENERTKMVNWFFEQDWNSYIYENKYDDAEKKINIFFENR